MQSPKPWWEKIVWAPWFLIACCVGGLVFGYFFVGPAPHH